MKAAMFVAAALAAAPWSFCAYAQEAPAHAAAAASAASKMKKLEDDKPAKEDGRDTVQRMRWGTSVIEAGLDKTTTSSVTKDEKEDVKESVKKSVEKKAEQLASGKPYAKIVARYAAEYGVSAELADAVIRVESNYRPNVRGSAGEVGLMQIKPATARMLGYTGSVKGLFDPEINIKYGMKYLAMADDLGDGTTCGTILKYNAGHAATRMNPVSKHYCGLVLAYLES
jgi:soluble lytic murein transglycosylase-like protein